MVRFAQFQLLTIISISYTKDMVGFLVEWSHNFKAGVMNSLVTNNNNTVYVPII